MNIMNRFKNGDDKFNLDEPKIPSLYLWRVPALVSAFAIVASIGLWQKTDTGSLHLRPDKSIVLEDLSIIKASDDLEFYQKLEFLHWMETTDSSLIKG